MRTHLIPWALFVVLGVATAVALSQPAGGDTRPTTTRAASQPSPDEVLGQMLKPRRTGGDRELAVTAPRETDRTSGKGSVKPSAPSLTVVREGTPIVKFNLASDSP